MPSSTLSLHWTQVNWEPNSNPEVFWQCESTQVKEMMSFHQTKGQPSKVCLMWAQRLSPAISLTFAKAYVSFHNANPILKTQSDTWLCCSALCKGCMFEFSLEWDVPLATKWSQLSKFQAFKGSTLGYLHLCMSLSLKNLLEATWLSLSLMIAGNLTDDLKNFLNQREGVEFLVDK